MTHILGSPHAYDAMLSIHTILFPTDESPTAEAARAVAKRLARRHGATLHTLRVEVIAPVDGLWVDVQVDLADDVVGLGSVEAHRLAGSAPDAILAYAREHDVDLIVMGTHGRSGLSRLALGSVAEAVLRRAPCPVLTVGPEAITDRDGPILTTLAFESASDVVLETAAALAKDEGRRVVALHVVEPIEIPFPYGLEVEPFHRKKIEAQVAATLERWVAPFANGSVPITPEVRHGHAADEILAAARTYGANLVVQASHGRRGPGRWLLGSVAEAVARHAPCPVLTLRTGARPVARLEGATESFPVPRADWAALLDALSKHVEGGGFAITVEVLSPDAEGMLFDSALLTGITYDPRDDAIEVMTAGGEHHAVHPFSIRSTAGAWALNATPADAAWSLIVVLANGTREQLSVRPARDAIPA